MQTTTAVPEWKYQRQFQSTEGVQTEKRRLPLFSEAAPRPLTDEQLSFFLANGYLVLGTELPESFHKAMFDRFVELIGEDNDHNPGNNLLPAVPELNRVFEDPVVRGALASVLGPDYLMHPHRVLHDNPPGSDAQVWHHDSYWGYKRKVHNHRPWWVMIMYYPQDIFPKIGPTGVIPGSQCIAQRLEGIDQLGVPAEGPAGTCMMIHYDIWHRKMKNLTGLKRFMVKFEFTRMSRPVPEAGRGGWRMPAQAPAYALEPLWRDQWRWLAGVPSEPAGAGGEDEVAAAVADLRGGDRAVRADAATRLARLGPAAAPAIGALAERLDDGSEPVGLNAAYALAAIGREAVPALIGAMRGNDGENVDDARVFIDEGQHAEVEMAARNAAHGLVSVGRPAVPAILGALADAGPRMRKYCVFALGEIDDDDPAVLSAIAVACADPDAYVRINAVEAAGLKSADEGIVRALVAALSDADDEVRFTAALSLARIGPAAAAAAAVPALADALTDGNRYVVGYAVEALQRIGTPEAHAVLLPFLKLARWCPLTTNRSLF